MSYIELGRENLRRQEAVKSSCGEIFSAVINCLKRNSRPYRNHFWKYQGLSHTVNSAEPSVNVYMAAGANLDKARQVSIEIDGIRDSLVVRKRVKNGTAYFEGYTVSPSGTPTRLRLTKDEAEGYLAAVRNVENELCREI